MWLYIDLTDYMAAGRHSTTRELAIMVLMAYLSYMLAEVNISVTPTVHAEV